MKQIKQGSPSIDAVVVNYNAGGWLLRSIESVLASEQVDQLTVVDNASVDDSLQRLMASSCAERCRVIKNTSNRGFGAAVNQALADSQAEQVLVLNPDCELSEDALLMLSEALIANPTAAIAGPLVLNADGTEQRACRRRTPTPKRALITMLGLERFGLIGVNIRDPLPGRATPMDAVSGAALLVRGDFWRQLGGFDAGYFLHCEDLDLFERTRRADRQILFVPTAQVLHAKGVSQHGRRLSSERYKHRGMVRFYRRFFAPETPVALRWVWPTLVWLRFAVFAPIWWLAGQRRVA